MREGPWNTQGGTNGHMDQMERTWAALGDDLGNSYMSTSSPSPGAVRSFGSAKARYDFCARDRTELTLREGDIIRVLSKKGHPGWWKGEIYGRVWHLPHPKVSRPRPRRAPHAFSQRVLFPPGWMVPRKLRGGRLLRVLLTMDPHPIPSTTLCPTTCVPPTQRPPHPSPPFPAPINLCLFPPRRDNK